MSYGVEMPCDLSAQPVMLSVMSLKTISAGIVVAALAGMVAVGAAQSIDEPAPVFKASAVLSATTLTGPHHKVAERVQTDGYLFEFTLTSDFGPFTALGRSELDRRIDEIRAIAALDDVSKTEVFLEAAGGAIVNIGKSAASVVTDPEGTAKGVGAGIKRFGVNLGRTSKRMVTPTEGGVKTESSAEGAANTVLGVSTAMRRWAQKVGADPYTTNPVLRDALIAIARVDAAGSIATKVAVPVPLVVSTVSSVGDLVWSKDPEELRKLNEARVKGLGVPEKVSAGFFRNGWYTLTLETRLIAALDAVKQPGCGDYLESASAAESEREAYFFVESAEMLKRHHARRPVDGLLTDSRAVVARSGGSGVLLAPVDYLHSTPGSREMLTEIAARVPNELGARRLELQLTGHASARVKQDARALGWSITESVSAR